MLIARCPGKKQNKTVYYYYKLTVNPVNDTIADFTDLYVSTT